MIINIYKKTKNSIIKNISSSRTIEELTKNILILDKDITGIFIIANNPVLKFFSLSNISHEIKLDSHLIRYINTNQPELLDQKSSEELLEQEKKEYDRLLKIIKGTHLIPQYINGKVFSLLCINTSKLKRNKLNQLKIIMENFSIVYEKIQETEDKIKIEIKKEVEENFRKELEQKNKLLEFQNKELEFSHYMLKKRTTELLKINKMNAMSDVISGIAHEISTPLLSISLATELLEKDVDKQEIIDGVKKSTSAIKKHLESLISFSFVSKKNKPFDLNDTLVNILKIIRFSISSGTTIKLKTSDTKLMFKGNHSEINMALYSLISMAISESSQIKSGEISISIKNNTVTIKNTGKINEINLLDAMDNIENYQEKNTNIEYTICKEIFKKNNCNFSFEILENQKTIAIEFPEIKQYGNN